MARALFLRLLLCGALLFTAAPIFAQESYFQLRVPVADQTAPVREEALREAMARALVRATGRDAAAADAKLQPFLRTPSRYVQLYRYEHTPDGLVLHVRLDAAALRGALAEQGVPVWSADRPPVLVWLGVERDGTRALVGADEAAGLRDRLMDAARDRGVLLLFPLLDTEDRATVSFSDVWGGFSEPVLTAAERYGTPLVLVGRMYADAGQWRARWQLHTEQGSSAWTGAADDLAGAAEQSAADLAARLGREYAEVAQREKGQKLRLRVEGVDDMAEYLRLERHLREAAGVSAVWPAALEGQDAAFDLELSGDPRRALRALEAGGLLAPLPAESVGPQPRSVEEYRYRLQL